MESKKETSYTYKVEDSAKRMDDILDTDDNDYDGIGNYIEKFILGEQKWVKLFLLMLMEHY